MEGIPCDYCGCSFSSSRNLAKHREISLYCARFSEMDPDFSCIDCGEIFNSRSDLKTHISDCDSAFVGEFKSLKNEIASLRKTNASIEHFKITIGIQRDQIKGLQTTIAKLLRNGNNR